MINNDLTKKIDFAKKIIDEASDKFAQEKTVLAWTGGKDSTVLLHMVREMYGSIKFPVMFNDSTLEFPEIYEFIEKVTEDWKLELVIERHDTEMLKKYEKSKSESEKFMLLREMKIKALKDFQVRNSIEAYIVGIRWDEHPSRSKEKFFSARKNHMRVHPILDFTEADIWEYIHKFSVPYVSLYDKGYRSLGEKPLTQKSVPGEGERSGRERKKEDKMAKLRNMGYW